MKALIDADIFQWEFGSATDNEYKPLSWPLVQARIQGRIDRILDATGADEYQLYLTTDDKSNFRYNVATIRPYKGNRTTEKPHWYSHIRNFLVDQRGADEVSGMEADDAISIAQWKDYKEEKYKYYSYIEDDPIEKSHLGELDESLSSWQCNTIICSRDKDLDMVPGWHYCWGAGKQKEKEMWWQDEISGLRCFYKQLLTGDSIDNIPGLYGVGRSSKLLSDIDSLDSELEMFQFVQREYDKRFGTYSEKFLIENARLLWMLRKEGELWEPPIT